MRIEPQRLSSKMKEELSASGVFTAAGVNAVLQKVVMESESTELRGSALRADFSASNSINILDEDSDDEQSVTVTQHSFLGKLNASSSIDGLREELDSSHQSLERNCSTRNIAPKRSSIDKGRTTITDSKSQRCTE